MDVEKAKERPPADVMPQGLMSSRRDKGKTPMHGVGPANVVPPRNVAAKRRIAIYDVILRLGATIPIFYAATTMGNAQEQLPFFTQFYQFRAEWDDVLTFRYFVVANSIVVGYLVLSLPFAIVGIMRPLLLAPRLTLVILDTVMLEVIISGASAAASIAYLAHNGNDDANWLPVCQQYSDFCQTISASIIASFVGTLTILFLVILSAFALRRNRKPIPAGIAALGPRPD